jgi:hypothetical protein
VTEGAPADPPGPPGASSPGQDAGDAGGSAAGSSGPTLTTVMAEIEEEAHRRRGELPARLERDLDALFLEHAPMGNRQGDMSAALRMLDASVFIDPVVPVASQRPAGAFVKKSLRSLNLWYIGYVTHQVSKFATAVSRSLHLVDGQLQELRRLLPPPSPVPVVAPGDAASWWRETAVGALDGVGGRVLHAACGDGWLVRALHDCGVDAYGVDPRPAAIERTELQGTDLRAEDALAHLRSVEPFSLSGAVLSGVVGGMGAGERTELVALLSDRLQSDGILVVHSLTPAAWADDGAPAEADLAPGRPLRAATWAYVLAGWTVDTHAGPSGQDYLVVARRHPA